MQPEKKRGWIAVGSLLFIVALVGFLTIPAIPYAGDPYAWHEEARSIVLNGTLHVPAEIAQSFGAHGQYYVYNPGKGLWYSKYGIVSSLLSTIPLSVEKFVTGQLAYGDTPIRILLLGIFYVLQALIIGYLLFEVTGFYTAGVFVRALFVILAFYSTYEWNYLRSTSAESTLLLFFLLFYFFVVRFVRRKEPVLERPLRDVYLAWLALGLLTETRFYFLVLAGVFGAFLVYLSRKELSFRYILRTVIIPGAVVVMILGLVNWFKFGSPLLSGYHGWLDPAAQSPFLKVIYDFTLSQQWSLIVCFPPLLLAFFGLRKFFLKHRTEAIFIASVFVVFLIIIGTRPFYRGEWAYGMRYFVFILPLLALPALYPLEWMCTRNSGYRHLKTILLSIVILAALCLGLMQMQMNRLDFFFKYGVEQDIHMSGINNNDINTYFEGVHYAQINRDHLQLDGQWRRLPYFRYLCRELQPEALASLEERIDARVSQSNLFWFPNANKSTTRRIFGNPSECRQ